MNPIHLIEESKQTHIKTLSVCVLDGDRLVVEMLDDIIGEFGYAAHCTSDPSDALEQVGRRACRVILCDAKISSVDGVAFLDAVLQRDPGVYVILMATEFSIEAAMDSIRRGAYDYLAKP